MQPLQSRVVTLFGRYIGTIRQEGLRWVNPFTVRRSISLRVRNLDSDTLKVNDAVGNPVEIAAVINWQVVDTVKAAFDVEHYEGFVAHPDRGRRPPRGQRVPLRRLRGGPGLAARQRRRGRRRPCRTSCRASLEVAGVAVLDTRLRRLAYAPEIAGEMLRRQQASAVVAARSRIVEGAVGMVEHALELLSRARGRRARRGAQGRHGVEPPGGALQRPRRPARRQPGSLYGLTGVVAERKTYLLRISPELYAALERWAADDLRSVNAQIEYLLTDAARKAGRLPKKPGRPRERPPR